MEIITTKTDIRTWIANNNPANVMGSFSGDEQRDAIAQLAEAIRQADHPAWGTDWEQWLADNAERLVIEEIASLEGTPEARNAARARLA